MMQHYEAHTDYAANLHPEILRNLTVQQQRAIELITQGFGTGQVAQLLSVQPSTVSKWRKYPPFRLALDRLREEQWVEAAEQSKALLVKALGTSSELMDPPNPPAVRQRAAATIIQAFTVRGGGLETISDPKDDRSLPELEASLHRQRSEVLELVLDKLRSGEAQGVALPSATEGVVVSEGEDHEAPRGKGGKGESGSKCPPSEKSAQETGPDPDPPSEPSDAAPPPEPKDG